MPSYRGIELKLYSQYDIERIPEYSPHPTTYTPNRPPSTTAALPPLVNHETATCNVFVPVFPGSHFWLSYRVLPPVPPSQHYLFKLYLNGSLVVKWSCDAATEWKGKTMFALFERESEDGSGKRRLEKRALCFRAPDGKTGVWGDVQDPLDLGMCLEVRVHRASGGKRVDWEAGRYGESEYAGRERGIGLANAGRAGPEIPKRFYKFALIDPVDQPFVTFRYFYRTESQLQELDVQWRDNSVFEVDSKDTVKESPKAKLSLETGGSEPEKAAEADRTSKRASGVKDEEVFKATGLGESSRDSQVYYTPLEMPGERAATADAIMDGSPEAHLSFQVAPPRSYRLSIPPRLKIDPPAVASRAIPAPTKNEALLSTAYQPHPAYPSENWAERTPSPVRSIRDGISTPPLGARRGFPGLTIMHAVSNAWKRRGSGEAEASPNTESRSTSRSVS